MARQPFWVERHGEQDLAVADRIHERSFMLPNHPGLHPDDIHHICDVVLAVE
jgi:dTDP-4-amino-4,6-dideoxygalactose transaminase